MDLDENRECTFKEIHYLEKYTENTKNKSAVYLMERNELDIYSRGEKFGYMNDKIEMSTTQFVSNWRIGHVLDEPNENFKKIDLSSFLSNNISLLLTIVVGYLLAFLITFFLIQNTSLRHAKKRKILELVAFKLPSLSYSQLKSLSAKIMIIFFFFNIFFFINLNMLSSMIKTEKVVIKTDELIDSREKIENTNKILYLSMDMIDTFRNAPENSFLKRLYEKKLYENRLAIVTWLDDKAMKNINKYGITSYYLFMRETVLLGHLSVLAFRKMQAKQFVFSKSNSYREDLRAIYMRKSLDIKKKEIIKRRY